MSEASRRKAMKRQIRKVSRANRDDASLPMEPFAVQSPERMAEAQTRGAGAGGPPFVPFYAAWVNNRYVVLANRFLSTEWGFCDHLWIRRADDRNLFPWQDLQRIKDELLGPERVALEVFPRRSELVDQANMRHLWVLPVGSSLSFAITFSATAGSEKTTGATAARHCPDCNGTGRRGADEQCPACGGAGRVEEDPPATCSPESPDCVRCGECEEESKRSPTDVEQRDRRRLDRALDRRPQLEARAEAAVKHAPDVCDKCGKADPKGDYYGGFCTACDDVEPCP